MRTPLLVAAIVCAASPSDSAAQQPATPASTPAAPVDSFALGRKWTQWLYAGQIDSLLAAYEPPQNVAEARQSLERTVQMLIERAGDEVSVIEEKFVRRNSNTQYWRTAKFSNFAAEPLMVRWAVNKRWEIIGIGLNPASQAPPIDKP